jgi:hypothetical protein
MVGYNVQSAVDTKHHLIVAHEVTNVGSDRSQLSRMAEQARAAIGSEAIQHQVGVLIVTAKDERRRPVGLKHIHTPSNKPRIRAVFGRFLPTARNLKGLGGFRS